MKNQFRDTVHQVCIMTIISVSTVRCNTEKITQAETHFITVSSMNRDDRIAIFNVKVDGHVVTKTCHAVRSGGDVHWYRKAEH